MKFYERSNQAVGDDETVTSIADILSGAGQAVEGIAGGLRTAAGIKEQEGKSGWQWFLGNVWWVVPVAIIGGLTMAGVTQGWFAGRSLKRMK